MVSYYIIPLGTMVYHGYYLWFYIAIKRLRQYLCELRACIVHVNFIVAGNWRIATQHIQDNNYCTCKKLPRIKVPTGPTAHTCTDILAKPLYKCM